MTPSELQVGDTIHEIETDYHSAYARLAPYVTEARAYLECGETEKAKDSLYEAVCIIDCVAKFGNMFCVASESR